MPGCLMEKRSLDLRYQQVISEYLDVLRCASHRSNGKFILNLCDAQVFKTKTSKLSCLYMVTKEYFFLNIQIYPVYIASRSWVSGICSCLCLYLKANSIFRKSCVFIKKKKKCMDTFVFISFISTRDILDYGSLPKTSNRKK